MYLLWSQRYLAALPTGQVQEWYLLSRMWTPYSPVVSGVAKWLQFFSIAGDEEVLLPLSAHNLPSCLIKSSFNHWRMMCVWRLDCGTARSGQQQPFGKTRRLEQRDVPLPAAETVGKQISIKVMSELPLCNFGCFMVVFCCPPACARSVQAIFHHPFFFSVAIRICRLMQKFAAHFNSARANKSPTLACNCVLLYCCVLDLLLLTHRRCDL